MSKLLTPNISASKAPWAPDINIHSRNCEDSTGAIIDNQLKEENNTSTAFIRYHKAAFVSYVGTAQHIRL
jgi:hypothetical protein